MRNIVVDLGKNSYPIYIEEGLLNHASDYILKDYPDRRIMIISDDNVYPLYGDILERQFAEKTFCTHFVLPPPKASSLFRRFMKRC